MDLNQFYETMLQMAVQNYDEREDCPQYEVWVKFDYSLTRVHISQALWIPTPEEVTQVQITLEQLASLVTNNYKVTIDKVKE